MTTVGPVPAAEQFVLAVDLGTSGVKVGLVSLTGAIAWHEHVHLSTRVDGDAATQDAAGWWEIVRECARRGLSSGAVPPTRVVAVSVTGQWASTVPVDGDGAPTGPCVLWMDTRGAPYSREVIGGPVAGYVAEAALTWIRRTGGAPSTSGADPDRTHPIPAGRRVGPVADATGPMVPRARRLPVHVLHRAAGGVPCVDGRRLADRQPPPRRAGLRPGAGGPLPESTRIASLRSVPPAR